MAAYCYFDILETKDTHKMEIYKEHVLATVDQYGGRYLVIGGPCDLVEGTSKPKYPIVIEFPGMDQAYHWYNSEECKALKALRQEAVEANAVFIQGL
jgi:uncharacterized protein (DUF1330 family)